MQINKIATKPTLRFSALKPGDAFENQHGDVCLKLPSNPSAPNAYYNLTKLLIERLATDNLHVAPMELVVQAHYNMVLPVNTAAVDTESSVTQVDAEAEIGTKPLEPVGVGEKSGANGKA